MNGIMGFNDEMIKILLNNLPQAGVEI